MSLRVYKKSSPNNKLTLYLASRDLIVSEAKIDKLQGVLLLDPEFLQGKRVSISMDRGLKLNIKLNY